MRKKNRNGQKDNRKGKGKGEKGSFETAFTYLKRVLNRKRTFNICKQILNWTNDHGLAIPIDQAPMEKFDIITVAKQEFSHQMELLHRGSRVASKKRRKRDTLGA